MSLRERFALHGRSTVDLSRETVKDTPPLVETPPVVQDETTARGAARSGAGRSGPAERLVVAPELRARGTAYGHGVYRLFVRGRAPREPFELPRASGVDISSARGTRVEVTGPIASAISEPPSPLPAPRLAPELPPTAAVPDLLALGPDLGGYLRRVVHWPHALVARPALLGGALARLELPGLDACQAMLPRLLARPIASIHPPLVFLDVETTALDRGAGALAFMIGLAVFVDGGLQIEQWILTRLSCEAAMLSDVLARLTALAGEGAVLGSFNGASFDLPLLRTRMRRAGRCVAALERPHLDLLPPARRMWRGHGSDCRLVTLERTQLGVRRVHDIEGHEIPAVFWAWLRRPDDHEVQAVMRRVADHNLADLVTLPALAAALYARITAPPDLDTAIRAAEHHLAPAPRRLSGGGPCSSSPSSCGAIRAPARARPRSGSRCVGSPPVTRQRTRLWPSTLSTTQATLPRRWRSRAARQPRVHGAWSVSSASSSPASRWLQRRTCEYSRTVATKPPASRTSVPGPLRSGRSP